MHNKYLLIMAETGIVGMVLFMLMLWKFLSVVAKEDFWADPAYYCLALGFSAGVFGQVVFFMLDHFYVGLRMNFLYIFFGLICAVVKLQKQANEELRGETRL